MRRAALLVTLAACARDHAPPAVEEATPRVGCGIAWRPTADATEVLPSEPTPTPMPSAEPKPGGEGGLAVDVQTPRVDGGLSAVVVKRVLVRAHDAMEGCYASRLETRPGLAGNLDLDFTIGPDGKVVTPSSIGLDRTLGHCLVRVLGTLQFGTPKGGGAKVRATIVLHPAVDDTPDPAPEEVVIPETTPPPPQSLLASMSWADDGADAGLASWASELATPSVAALDFSGCELGATGSVHATLGVGRDGETVQVEAHGLGSAAMEDCVKVVLSTAVLAAPPASAVLHCELAFGAPSPARITVRPGQPVIDVGVEVRLAGSALALADLPAALAQLRSGEPVVIVRTSSHADATLLAGVVEALVVGGTAYVVGVEDATGSYALVVDGVPRGVGRPRATVGARPRVELGGGTVVATVPGRGVIATGALGDLASARAVLVEVAACGECEQLVEVAVGAGVEARWLGDLAAWSAEAGLPRLVLARPGI